MSGEMAEAMGSPIADASTVMTCRGGVEKRVQANASLLSKRPNFAAYKCDVCDKYPIRGYRWECTNCEDFDMCNACQKHKNGGHAPSHLLVRFKVAPAAKATKWRPNETSKEGPALTQRTLSRMQSTDGSSSTLLRTEVSRLKVPLPVKKVGSRKGELAMRLFETGVDTYEATLDVLRLDDEVPACVERLFLTNGLVLSDLIRVGTYESLVETTDARGIPPFDAFHVTSVLSGVIGQLMHRDKHQFAWFSDPVPKDVPRYYETVKSPMDLGTLSKSLEAKIAGPATLASRDPVEVFAEVIRDLNLVWENATLFNPAQHPVHEEALHFRWLLSVLVANVCALWPTLHAKYCAEGTKFPVKSVSYSEVRSKPLPRTSLASATPKPSATSALARGSQAPPPMLERVISSGSTLGTTSVAKPSRKRILSPLSTSGAIIRETSQSSTGSADSVARNVKAQRTTPSVSALCVERDEGLRSVREGVKQLHERLDEVEAALGPLLGKSDPHVSVK